MALECPMFNNDSDLSQDRHRQRDLLIGSRHEVQRHGRKIEIQGAVNVQSISGGGFKIGFSLQEFVRVSNQELVCSAKSQYLLNNESKERRLGDGGVLDPSQIELAVRAVRMTEVAIGFGSASDFVRLADPTVAAEGWLLSGIVSKTDRAKILASTVDIGDIYQNFGDCLPTLLGENSFEYDSFLARDAAEVTSHSSQQASTRISNGLAEPYSSAYEALSSNQLPVPFELEGRQHLTATARYVRSAYHMLGPTKEKGGLSSIVADGLQKVRGILSVTSVDSDLEESILKAESTHKVLELVRDNSKPSDSVNLMFVTLVDCLKELDSSIRALQVITAISAGGLASETAANLLTELDLAIERHLSDAYL